MEQVRAGVAPNVGLAEEEVKIQKLCKVSVRDSQSYNQVLSQPRIKNVHRERSWL